MDYYADALTIKTFFKTVQNKLYFAIHGKTATEFIKLQIKGQMDEEVYNEEYVRILGELQKLRQDKSKIETGNVSIEQYQRKS